MVVLIVLAYILIGSAEIMLWKKRDLSMVILYTALMLISMVFSVLIMLGIDIPTISPIDILLDFIGSL